MLPRTLALLALCCALVACSKNNPAYCDQASDCSGELDFCDFDGLEGLGKTCVADPQDESCNFAETCGDGEVCKNDPEDGLAGICVECLGDDDCQGNAPFCNLDNNSCETPTCEQGSAGDDFCMMETPNTPVCGPEGRCAECNQSQDCTTSAKAVCDTEIGECRGCEAHSECQTGACDLDSGMCLEEQEIIYISSSSGSDGVLCGTSALPCATFNGMQGALAKVTQQKDTIVVLTGSLSEAAVIDNLNVTIIGQGDAALVPQLGGDQAVVRVINGSTVTISGLTLGQSGDDDESMALRCLGNSTVTMEDSVLDTVRSGIDSNNCDLTLLRLVVKDSRKLGISFEGGSLDLRQSVIERNAGGGIYILSADYEIVNTLVTANGDDSSATPSVFGGIRVDGIPGDQRLEHTTIVGNLIGSEASHAAGITCSGTTPMGRNNLISPAGATSPRPLITNCGMTHSLIEGVTHPGEGNISDVPTFVNGFHLDPDSAGVDDGTGDEVKIDFDGDSRPQGEGPDMGMDEVTVD